MAFDLQRLSPAARRTIYRVATLAGVAFLVAAGLQAGASLKLVRNGEHLTGKVVTLGGGPGPLFVQFTRPDGQVTAFRPTGPVWVRRGDSVPVILDPTRAGAPPVAATPLALWLQAGAMGLVGALLFAFGFNKMERRKP